MQHPFRTIRLLPATIAATVCVAPAVAQFGGDAGLADAFRQDFYRRDLVIFNNVLDLEDWQRPIVEVLLEDYAASFEAGLTAMRNEIADMRVDASGDGRAIMERMMQPLEAWEQDKELLADQFLANVRTQLSPVQEARWPALERALRREKDLPQSELSGEGLDLVAVLARVQVPPQVLEAIAPTIDQYETDLDRALLARAQRMDSLQPAVREAMQEMNFQRGLQIMEQIMAARIEVRSAQERGLEAIASALPEEFSATFRQEALEQAFPKVYGPNSTISFIAAAKAIEDLTPEQLEGIEAIERDYLAQLEVLNARMRELYRIEEPQEPQRRFERILQRQQGESPRRRTSGEPEAIRTVRGEREELGRRTREAILALLTPDQSTRLPGFAKPGSMLDKGQSDGRNYQETPTLNAGGLGAKGPSKDERRGNAFAPVDRSPRNEEIEVEKRKDSDRIRSQPSRGGTGGRGGSTPSGRDD
ncbi:MAG: hypothetical protein ACO3P9_01425 [Phycisphaerales bacterium]